MSDWFYMSFCDPQAPKGEQFLGGAYVQGDTIEEALTRSHLLGVNPGGEVAFQGPAPDDALRANVPAENLERLLTADEVNP